MVHKILCPIDLSENSKVALRTAAAMSTGTDAALVLVHVWVSPFIYGPVRGPEAGMFAESRAHAEEELARLKAEAEGLGATRVSILLLTGTPWHEIVNLANKDTAIETIVMGTHGRTGLEHAVLGSVAERVVRHAPCSVFVIRPHR